MTFINFIHLFKSYFHFSNSGDPVIYWQWCCHHDNILM